MIWPNQRARLRCVNAVRINRRTFQVINFPAREMRAADFPSFARAIRSQDERAFLVPTKTLTLLMVFSCFCLLDRHSLRFVL